MSMAFKYKEADMPKILILYFLKSGHTKKLAEEI